MIILVPSMFGTLSFYRHEKQMLTVVRKHCNHEKYIGCHKNVQCKEHFEVALDLVQVEEKIGTFLTIYKFINLR